MPHLNSHIAEVPSSGVFHSRPVRLHKSRSPAETLSSAPGLSLGELNTHPKAESLLQGIVGEKNSHIHRPAELSFQNNCSDLNLKEWKNWFNDNKSFLTNDYVQSRRNRVDHSYGGITHAVCGAYCRCKTTGCVPLQPRVRCHPLNTWTAEGERHYLRGWCRYGADKAVKWQLDRSHNSPLLAASARSARGVFRWTCRPHPHTPRCRRTKPERVLLRGSTSHRAHLFRCSADRPYPSKPVRSFFRRWSLAWFARSVTKQNVLLIQRSCQSPRVILSRHSPITWELIPASSNRGATREW